MDLILQPGPGSRTSLSFFDRPAAYFIFRAPSGWGCDQTCQHPDGGGGGLSGHLTGADRKLSFRQQLFYKRIDTVLWGQEQKPPEPGVWKRLQGSSDKYRVSRRVWKLPCVAPGTAVRAERAPRWQRSLFKRGGWTWELPLRPELLTNRPLSQQEKKIKMEVCFSPQSGLCLPQTRSLVAAVPWGSRVYTLPRVVHGAPQLRECRKQPQEVSGKDHSCPHHVSN